MGTQAPRGDDFPFVTDLRTPSDTPREDLTERTFCGDLDIRIAYDGTWHYNGHPVERPQVVRLFATMLVRDQRDGRYWLVSSSEMGRIDVEDAPFIVSEMFASGSGQDQSICLGTNADEVVCISADTPLVMRRSPVTGHMTPYVQLGDGIDARINRAIYYELVELCEIRTVNGQEVMGLWSDGDFFIMGRLDVADA